MFDFVRVAPDTSALVMDLIAEAQDWPGAAKIAERLKKFLEMRFPGIDEPGPVQQPPDIDQNIKQAKFESISLGNIKKEQDIAEQHIKTRNDQIDRMREGVVDNAGG